MASTTNSTPERGWSDELVRAPKGIVHGQVAVPRPSIDSLGAKRMCCEPMNYGPAGCRPELVVALPSVGAPGVWAGILN